MRPDRRGLLRSAGAAALTPMVSHLPGCATPTGAPLAARDAPRVAPRRFPDGFLWGTATAAYQVEGAVREDGRGDSIWDVFVRQPGRIRGGATADTAADHYHRWPEDIALMRTLGTNAYRFSIAWPRVFPHGAGAPNPAGLDFYDRLVDALLAAGIRPFATLYHWDLPQALQARGGWEARDTARAFADYAGHVAARLSDRVRDFITVNEMRTFVDLGYGGTVHAPGLALPPARVNQARHHVLLGHGLAVQAIRAASRAGTRVGVAENMLAAVPAVAGPEHLRAAQRATREINAGYLTAILEGRYTDAFLAQAGRDAPRHAPDEMRAIGSPLDFVGLNFYHPGAYVTAGDDPRGWVELPVAKSHPRFAASWQFVDPQVMYWGPWLAQALWRPAEIHVTENGCGTDDAPGPDGVVADTERVAFLRGCLAELHRAIADGAKVAGCFHWSLIDNFEWADGYAVRFGLVRVDFATQRRTPKLSARAYAAVARANALD